jgi:hypothetical protein
MDNVQKVSNCTYIYHRRKLSDLIQNHFTFIYYIFRKKYLIQNFGNSLQKNIFLQRLYEFIFHIICDARCVLLISNCQCFILNCFCYIPNGRYIVVCPLTCLAEGCENVAFIESEGIVLELSQRKCRFGLRQPYVEFVLLPFPIEIVLCKTLFHLKPLIW